MTRATGSFEVEIGPQPLADADAGPMLARMTIHKRFDGDLVGTSRGEMLSARSSVQGSAGYVAIERVSATLAGRTGTFVLQHSGVMTRGERGLTVTIVPDTGTDALEGIAGTLDIKIVEGKHLYELAYTLPTP